MNARNGLFILLLLGFGMLFQSCNKDECTAEITYTQYLPIWLTADDIRQPIEVESPRPLVETGKIYYYDNYILVNELREGIHVIDNSNPEFPENIAFIKIVGNVDMAIKGNILYADNFMDLLAINFSDPLNASLVKRVENVFPLNGTDGNGSFLAYYEEKEVTEEVPCNQSGWWGGPFVEFDMLAGNASGSNSGQNVPAGVGGSMARFTLYSDYLYTVDERDLRVFNISNVECPVFEQTVFIGWGIETIFPYDDKLFIGSNSGMFIFDNSTPSSPTQLAVFQHATSCDPVYVKDNYAYVTLRSGNACQGFTNQLDLIDITNLTSPELIESFPMHNPHGLSILNESLFLCEGDQGLKVFDIENPLELDQHKIDQVRDFHAFDVIALPNGLLMVIGKDGLYQYDAADPSDLKKVSVIPVLSN